MVGVDTSQTEFDKVEETGGNPDAIIPYHYHSVSAVSIGTSGTHNHQVICSLDNGSTQSGSGNDYVYKNNSGGSRMLTETSGGHTHSVPAHNTAYAGTSGNTKNANLQPYITVYYWKRTA
ncbi:MAG: hypothetical protein Q4C46_05470 [Bacillota bacterium]|nr:hypothetical protein [Bacillota bacterium]